MASITIMEDKLFQMWNPFWTTPSNTLTTTQDTLETPDQPPKHLAIA